MFKIFKDWRLCDISTVDLVLDKQYIYYIHARAWALKGWIGGTHSCMAVWSKKLDKWLVVESTDAETLAIQGAEILYTRSHDLITKGPFVSDRDPRQRWFNARPFVVGKVLNIGIDLDQLVDACAKYPVREFRLVSQNCNTFISYLIVRFGLKLKRPLRSIGFRSAKQWRSYYGIET